MLGNAEPLKTLLRHIRSKFDRDFLYQGCTDIISVDQQHLSFHSFYVQNVVEVDTRRQKVVEELVTTEKTYVTLLQTLIQVEHHLLCKH